uniref:Hypothetical secreted peptide n=1 Tax=Hyalomma rufipes TaxID=72862 RepID=E2J6T0_HYARU
MALNEIKCSIFILAMTVLVVVSHDIDSCNKTTLLIGNGPCMLGAVPIPPGQVIQLRCPCANVSCHDSLRRIIVSWC